MPVREYMVYTAGARVTVGVPLNVTFPKTSIEVVIPAGRSGEKLQFTKRTALLRGNVESPTSVRVENVLGIDNCPLDMVGAVNVIGNPVTLSYLYTVMFCDTLYVGGGTVSLSGYFRPRLSKIVNIVPGVDVVT